MESFFGTLKTLVGTLVMPFPMVLGVSLCGLVLLLLGRRRAGLGVVLGSFLLLVLLSWRPVAEGLLAPLEDRYPPLTDVAGLDGVAAVVVLGGGWRPGAAWPISSQLGESSAMRLFEGVRLLRALPDNARLVVSGASRFGDVEPVAVGYAQGARELGVSAERILLLDTPVDTAQEAYAVREALGTESRFLLVTSAAHMPRAVQHFRTVGLTPIPAPTQRLSGRSNRDRVKDWLPSAGELDKTERALHEYLGLLALRWDHLGPSFRQEAGIQGHGWSLSASTNLQDDTEPPASEPDIDHFHGRIAIDRALPGR